MSNAYTVIKHLNRISKLVKQDAEAELYQKSKDVYRSDVVLAVNEILAYVSSITGIHMSVVGSLEDKMAYERNAKDAKAKEDNLKNLETRLKELEARVNSFASGASNLPVYVTGKGNIACSENGEPQEEPQVKAEYPEDTYVVKEIETNVKVNVKTYQYPESCTDEFCECLDASWSDIGEDLDSWVHDASLGHACADWFRARYIDFNLPKSKRAFNLCNAPGWLVNYVLGYCGADNLKEAEAYIDDINTWSKALETNTVVFGGPKCAQNKYIKSCNLTKDKLVKAYKMWCNLCAYFNSAAHLRGYDVKLYKEQFVYRLKSLQLASDAVIDEVTKKACV